jgi:hypothetical protein
MNETISINGESLSRPGTQYLSATETSLPLVDHSWVPCQQKALKPLALNLYPYRPWISNGLCLEVLRRSFLGIQAWQPET